MASSDPLYLPIPVALRTISQGKELQPHASKPHTLAPTYTLRTRKIFRDQVADDRSDFQSRSQSGLWRKDQPTITANRYHRRPPYRNPATLNKSLEGTSPSLPTLTPHDPLPPGWYPKGIRKQSADDTHNLRDFWERRYGIETPVDRRKSEPAGYKFHRFNIIQRKWWYNSMFDRFPTWLGPLSSKRPGLQPTQFGPLLTPPMRQTRLGSRTTSGTWLVRNAQGLDGLYQSCFDFGQGIVGGIDTWLRLFWWSFQRPICLILSLLFLMEIIALGYTITSNAFLDNFCEMKLPGVRDWVCPTGIWHRCKDAILKQQQTSIKVGDSL